MQSLRFYRDPYGFLADCQRRFGDCFTIRQIPCGTIVYLADPQAVRTVFADPGRHLAGVVNRYMVPVLGQGLLVLDGEAHARERRLVAPALAHDRVRQAEADIRALTLEALARWPLGEPVALRPRLEDLTLRVILRLLFGAAADGRLAELQPELLELKRRGIVDSVLRALPFGVSSWRLTGASAEAMARIDALVHAELALRRAGGARGGLVDALVAEPALDDRQRRDELMTIVFAGHETVATTLAWVFERVTRHPDVLARLHADPADEQFLDAIIKETMRQRSCIADVSRDLAEPLEVGAYVLPAGTRVCPALVCVHMRADLYPEPASFRPARFLPGGRQPEPWTFFPFGGGVRRCLGAAFAMLEMRTILGTIAGALRLAPSTAAPERGTGNGVTIGPHRGAEVVMVRA
jgi:cytochrome P450